MAIFGLKKSESEYLRETSLIEIESFNRLAENSTLEQPDFYREIPMIVSNRSAFR